MDQLNKETQAVPTVSENSTGGTTVRKYVVDEVVIYEVKESELDELERGSQSDLYLEFSIACVSTFISFLIALFTVDFPENTNTEVIFVCVDVIMAIAGAIFGSLWIRQRKNKFKVIESIKKRKR